MIHDRDMHFSHIFFSKKNLSTSFFTIRVVQHCAAILATAELLYCLDDAIEFVVVHFAEYIWSLSL